MGLVAQRDLQFLSLAIFNNLVLTISSKNWKNPSYKKGAKTREPTLLFVEYTFSLLVYIDDQCGEFLESWMAYLEFEEFPDIIEYYTTIGNSTLLKEKYNTIKECTQLKDINHFMYLTQLYFLDNTPNQILHIMSKLLPWLKIFYTTIGQYPTLYDFLAIIPEEITYLNYYLTYPSKSVKLKIF